MSLSQGYDPDPVLFWISSLGRKASMFFIIPSGQNSNRITLPTMRSSQKKITTLTVSQIATYDSDAGKRKTVAIVYELRNQIKA